MLQDIQCPWRNLIGVLYIGIIIEFNSFCLKVLPHEEGRRLWWLFSELLWRVVWVCVHFFCVRDLLGLLEFWNYESACMRLVSWFVLVRGFVCICEVFEHCLWEFVSLVYGVWFSVVTYHWQTNFFNIAHGRRFEVS